MLFLFFFLNAFAGTPVHTYLGPKDNPEFCHALAAGHVFHYDRGEDPTPSLVLTEPFTPLPSQTAPSSNPPFQATKNWVVSNSYAEDFLKLLTYEALQEIAAEGQAIAAMYKAGAVFDPVKLAPEIVKNLLPKIAFVPEPFPGFFAHPWEMKPLVQLVAAAWGLDSPYHGPPARHNNDPGVISKQVLTTERVLFTYSKVTRPRSTRDVANKLKLTSEATEYPDSLSNHAELAITAEELPLLLGEFFSTLLPQASDQISLTEKIRSTIQASLEKGLREKVAYQLVDSFQKKRSAISPNHGNMIILEAGSPKEWKKLSSWQTHLKERLQPGLLGDLEEGMGFKPEIFAEAMERLETDVRGKIRPGFEVDFIIVELGFILRLSGNISANLHLDKPTREFRVDYLPEATIGYDILPLIVNPLHGNSTSLDPYAQLMEQILEKHKLPIEKFVGKYQLISRSYKGSNASPEGVLEIEHHHIKKAFRQEKGIARITGMISSTDNPNEFAIAFTPETTIKALAGKTVRNRFTWLENGDLQISNPKEAEKGFLEIWRRVQ